MSACGRLLWPVPKNRGRCSAIQRRGGFGGDGGAVGRPRFTRAKTVVGFMPIRRALSRSSGRNLTLGPRDMECRRWLPLEVAHVATDADQGAEAWPCRHQASAATGRAHGAAGQGVCRAGACGGRHGRRRMAGEHDARAARLRHAARTKTHGRSKWGGISADRWSVSGGERRSDREAAAGIRAVRRIRQVFELARVNIYILPFLPLFMYGSCITMMKGVLLRRHLTKLFLVKVSEGVAVFGLAERTLQMELILKISAGVETRVLSYFCRTLRKY